METKMPTLLTIAEAAPQFRKSQDAMRYWLRKSDCPIRVVAIGGRRFISQESIDGFFADVLQKAS
jgi:uncharacterized protein Usg